MVFDVMKLRAQVRRRSPESLDEFVFQITNPRDIPQSGRDLSKHSAAVAVPSCTFLDGRATARRKRGHRVRIFFRDRSNVLLAAYCLLLPAFCRLPTADYLFRCSPRRKHTLLVQL